MNFEGFKKVASDNRATILQHPKGHAIKIAHNALSEEMRKKLEAVPHYSDGGETQDSVEPMDEGDGEEAADVTRAPASSFTDMFIPSKEDLGKMISNIGSSVMGLPQEAQAPSSPNTEAAQPMGDAAQQQAEVGPLVAAKPAPSTGAIDAGIDSKSLGKSYDAMESGIRNEAAAEGALGKQQSDIYGKLGTDLSTQNKDMMDRYNNLEEKSNALVADLQKGHIEPNNLVNNMSTWSKVASSIGLILGGISSGLTGKGNPAAEYLDKQISNDIDAQKSDLGRKESLLSHNLQMMGNLRDAMAMTKANLLDVSKAQIEQAAAKSQDPILRARAQKGASQIEILKQQALGPLKYKQQLMNAASSGQMKDPTALVTALVPPKDQPKVNEEIAVRQHINDNRSQLDKLWHDTQKENTLLRTVGGLRSSPSRDALKALLLPVIHKQFGRITDTEVDAAVDGLLPKKGRTDAQQDIAYKAFHKFLSEASSATTAKSHGINLDNFQTTSSDPYMRLSPEQKHLAQQAKQLYSSQDANARQMGATALKKLGFNLDE